MGDRSAISPVNLRILTDAERLAISLPSIELPALVYVYDTGHAWLATVAAGSNPDLPTIQWSDLTPSPFAAGWPKYVVSEQATPLALYTTIQAAIDAAVADGHGTATPAVVLVMPGTYPGAVDMRSGISVVGFSGDGLILALVTGHVTLHDEAGLFQMQRMEVVPASGSAVTFGGTHGALLQLDECTLGSADAAALRVSNSGGSTVLANRSTIFGGTEAQAGIFVDHPIAGGLTFEDCKLNSNNTQTMKSVDTAAQFVARRCLIDGQVLGTAAAILLEYCTVSATEQDCLHTTGGAPIQADWCTLSHTQVAAFNTVVGASAPGTVFSSSGLSVPNNTLISANITQTPREGFFQTTRQAFAGAGPFSPINLADDNVVTPGAGVVTVINLPDVTTQPVRELSFTNVGTTSDMVLLIPFGAQTILGATFFRVFQGGSVRLRPAPASGVWRVLANTPGIPTTLTVTADNAGVDTNPGTVALPVQSIRAALKLCNTGWSVSGTVQLTSGYNFVEVDNSNILVPGSMTQTGRAVKIQGPAQIDAGFGIITVTGGVTGNNTAPLSYSQSTFGAVAGLAANAGAGFIYRGLSGAVAAVRGAVRRTTTTSVEVLARFGAIASGTFRLTKPDATWDLSGVGLGPGFVAGTGTGILFEDISISGGGLAFNAVDAAFSWCRSIGAASLSSQNCCLIWGIGSIGSPNTAKKLGATSVSQCGADLVAGSLSLLATDGRLEIRGSCFNSAATSHSDFSGQDLGWDAPASAASIMLVGGSAGVLQHVVVSGAGGTPIVVDSASELTLNLTALSPGTAGAIGLVVDNNSTAIISGVQGTLPAGTDVGVDARRHSRVTVTDPNVAVSGTLIAGAAGAVRVGAAGVKTWAQIAAAAAADILDTGAPGSTAVSVSV